MRNVILFDWDGTLLNSNELISASHLHVLNRHLPGQYDKEKVKAFNGPPLIDVYEELFPQHGEEFVAEYRAYNHKYHDQMVSLFPDVEKSLAKLKNSGKKLAIVSTKKKDLVIHAIQLFGLEKYFDVIVAGTDYEKHKPDPEALYLALEKLDSKPREAIMVGDNWQDIAAAKHAGMPGVFVNWSEKEVSELLPHKPDKVVNSMVELTEWLLDM